MELSFRQCVEPESSHLLLLSLGESAWGENITGCRIKSGMTNKVAFVKSVHFFLPFWDNFTFTREITLWNLIACTGLRAMAGIPYSIILEIPLPYPPILFFSRYALTASACSPRVTEKLCVPSLFETKKR